MSEQAGAAITTQWNGFGEVSVLIAGVEVFMWQDGGHNEEAWCRDHALRAFAYRLAEVLNGDSR